MGVNLPLKAEILCVGSELLLGDVVNTNATWISKELAAMGIDVYYHTVVGDNPTRIHGVLESALQRSNLLVFTGGLGPTDDDLTVPTLAEYFHVDMEMDERSAEQIQTFFMNREKPILQRNLKQAMIPAGAQAIPNLLGTAPGVFWDVTPYVDKPTYLLVFPGVPKELHGLWEEGLSLLQGRLPDELNMRKQVIVSRTLHFFGIGESVLNERLVDLMTSTAPSVAPYVGKAEVRLRLTAKADSVDGAEALIAPVRDTIVDRCGDYYFGDNGVTLEQAVAQLLLEGKDQVSVAESCTGGLVSSRLTDVPGSSAYTSLNVVTYSNAQKTTVLGVPELMLEQHGAVSAEVAGAMVKGIQRLSGSSMALSLTGIAGPGGGTSEKPVGLVYIGVLTPGQSDPTVHRVLVNRHYARQEIKFWFSQYALHYLWKALKGNDTD